MLFNERLAKHLNKIFSTEMLIVNSRLKAMN